jgi:hypothetical protein
MLVQMRWNPSKGRRDSVPKLSCLEITSLGELGEVYKSFSAWLR